MRLVAMKQLLQMGLAGHYAVPAFNICNLETIQGVLEVAEEMRSPVILQAHWLEAYYSTPRNVVQMAEELGRDRDVLAAVHLDHGATYEDAVRCVRGGFTSVMYDGSCLPLDENIATLRKVVEMAAAVGVTVEGEIGTIGQTSEMGEKIENAYLTHPADAKRLVDETCIDCLAVAIGNAHGFYKQEPRLDFDRLREIADAVKIPLVLHGGTGIPREQIQRAITMGIAKINFSTVLRSAFISRVHDFMTANPDELGLMDILAQGKEAMKVRVADCIDMCMSANRR
jgi:fructose-bisphosphate aldolase class II